MKLKKMTKTDALRIIASMDTLTDTERTELNKLVNECADGLPAWLVYFLRCLALLIGGILGASTCISCASILPF